MARTPSEFWARCRIWFSHHWEEIWWAFAFAALCAVAVDYGKDAWRGPDEYTIYLVGKLGDDEIQNIFTSFEKFAESNKLSINGVRIGFDRKDDKGDPATAQEIATTLAKAPNTLLVIGHVLTQETKAALPIYMGASPPVPLIATTETDDELTSGCKPCSKGFVPLIQMSPTNEAQSKSAVRYAVEEQKRKRFLLVSERNDSNASYSRDLMRDYREALKEYGFKGAKKVGEVEMGPPLTSEALTRWDPDCRVYAGEHDTAETLMASLQPLSRSKSITLILSDSAVNRGLRQPDSFSGPVFYTYQSDAYYYRKDLNVYGQDAFALVRQIVSESDNEQPGLGAHLRNLVGMRRVFDARRDIIHNMQRHIDRAIPYVGASGEVYKLVGYKRDTYFHVWEVQNGAVQDVDGWHPPKF